jgi:hypothetical protein
MILLTNILIFYKSGVARQNRLRVTSAANMRLLIEQKYCLRRLYAQDGGRVRSKEEESHESSA